jgi:hypothetical protein
MPMGIDYPGSLGTARRTVYRATSPRLFRERHGHLTLSTLRSRERELNSASEHWDEPGGMACLL